MMTAHLAMLAFAAVGHFCLFTAIINWSHGLTYLPKWIDRMILLTVLLSIIATLAGGAWLALHPWGTYPALVKFYLAACIVNGAVVLPVVTIARLLRRVPAGIHGSSRTIDLAAKHGAETLIGNGRHAWWLRIPGNDSLSLRLNHWRITRDDLPAAIDGLSILHVTDFHFAPTYRRDYFDRVIDALDSRTLDLVLFTGDLIDDPASLPWIEPVLSRLRGRLGTFAILGNHDLHHDTRRIIAEIERSGFVMSEGAWTILEIRGARIAIGGNNAPWGPRPEPGTIPEADYSILLSHSPDQFHWAVSEGIDLVFSGHNHGGQVRLPIVGPVLMPSRYGRRFDRGFFRKGRTLLYSNQGVGAEHPLRWNCLPEVATFELLRARSSPAQEIGTIRRRDDPWKSPV
jgi:predicted MPP superfamily phosphohydrolase